MRLVILGKFPPIEGGVSCQTYWTALELAERGHEVHVVTNANEVDPGYREFLFGQDLSRLTGQHLTTPLHVHQTTALRRDSFIPWANPYGSKLFGTALGVIEEFGCDLILGWYFEPYGLIAAQLGKACGKPVALRHAGSDIGRLADQPDLRRSYQWMVSQAAALLSTGRGTAVTDILTALGVTEKQRHILPVARLPEVYSNGGQPLDIQDLFPRLPAWYQSCGLSTEIANSLRVLNDKPFSSGVPTVGTYGKIGEIKGSYRLLETLEHLANKGMQFNFLVIAGFRSQEMQRYLREIAGRRELARRTWILPPLAPWRIPAFLSACNIVCHLEHDFPITFHTPLIPREVLASGACLVVSGEVAEKQSFQESLSDGKNVVLIQDPKDTGYLAEQIGNLLADPQKARIIGKHGQYLSQTCEKFFRQRNSTADALEDIGKKFMESAHLP